jgi:hypothetical protein
MNAKSPSIANEHYFMPLDRTPRRCVWRSDADLSKPQCEGTVNPAFRFTVCCDMHTAAWQRIGSDKAKKHALIAAAASDAAHAAVREK